MGAWRQVIVYEKCKPILADKIRYYSEGVFTARLMPAPEVPQLDWVLYRARTEGRVRRLDDSEAPSIELRRLAHDVSDLPAISNASSDEEISRFVDAYFARLEIAPLDLPFDAGTAAVNEISHNAALAERA